ncbi:MAG: tetratricopeptide repeat protein [Limisphaerales bacterium]
MKLKSALAACLVHCLLWAIGTSYGYTQVSVATPNSSIPNLSPDQVKELRQKWEKVPPTDLLKEAEGGNAQAQYYFWAREWNQAWEDENRASDEMYSFWHQLNAEQKKKAESNWKTAAETELRNAAESGDIGAKVYWAKLKVDQALQRATNVVQWLDKSAEQGFPLAEYDAAIQYLGQSSWAIVGIDQPKGLALLQKSAGHGWSPAQFKLGMLYIAGELLPPDSAKAVEWLQKAADQGGPRSQYELARLYAAGIGEPRSTANAPLALMRRSATNGYSLALQALAERYRTGLGVPVDYVQAIRYYQAAQAAEKEAGENPEHRTRDVFSVVDENLQPNSDIGPSWRNFAEVLSVYLKATQRADAAAMNQLGEWHLAGWFLPQDSVAAYYWYSRAAEFGAAGAAGKRDTLKAGLSPEQLEQAAKLNTPAP